MNLKAVNKKIKGLIHLKSEFLSLTTHQIRAPLTAIKGYSSMLIDGDFGKLPRKVKGPIKMIARSCQDLINIVEDFLDISRIEQGRMIYEKSVFDLKKLVKEVVNEIKPNIRGAGLSLKLDVPKNFSIEINADRNKIKQAIGNIVDNAIKYTDRGHIIVSAFIDKNKAKVAIKDSGIGIEFSEMNRIFAKFSRAKDIGKTNISGTGLGLYIAKKIAKAHGGDIRVESKGAGRGSTFTIELPFYKKIKKVF